MGKKWGLKEGLVKWEMEVAMKQERWGYWGKTRDERGSSSIIGKSMTVLFANDVSEEFLSVN